MTRPGWVLFVILDTEQKLSAFRATIADCARQGSGAFFNGEVRSSRNRRSRGNTRAPKRPIHKQSRVREVLTPRHSANSALCG